MKQEKGMMKKDPGVKKVETAGWTKKEEGDKSGSGVYGTKRQNPQKQTWNLMEMRTETKQKKRCKRTDEGKRDRRSWRHVYHFFFLIWKTTKCSGICISWRKS